jgi:NAD(P)-dependent dehydrogenase (short-subunit alcohol dehydrogenase family)
MTDQSLPLKSLFDLSGQIAIVTGGSRGLGLHIAEALGEYGATVILTARKQNELDEAVQHLTALGAKADAFAGDFGKAESITAFADWLASKYDRADILVNNAGTSWGSPAEDHPIEGWNKVMAINLTGPFLLTQAVAKRWMIPAGHGRVINVASVEGLQGHHVSMGGMLAYSTSKGGLVNFTRALAAEWGRYGITVNALAPGYFPSKLTEYILQKIEGFVVENTPMGKLGGANDLKGAALLFASAAGGHISGQILAIDGGATVI